MKDLKCDMKDSCKCEVNHIDIKGFVYCDTHGKNRKLYMRCRKLKPNELKKLKNGEQLGEY